MLTYPKVTGQIKFISCIYNPTPLYGRESQRANQRWKALQLNPVRRPPLGRSFLVKDTSWFLRIISGKKFDLGWSWPPLGEATT